MSGINYYKRMGEIATDLEKREDIKQGMIPKITFFNAFMLDQSLTTNTTKKWLKSALDSGLIELVKENDIEYINFRHDLLQ